MPSAPTGSMPPHLAASIAAGYGQRLMGGGHILHPQPQQNGSSTHRRDAPTFKARIGCNACEDCRGPDCRICLVCLDRRFFNSKYMAGALCAKKRCNNATALELPISIEHQQRTSLKRSSDGSNNGNFTSHQQAKRQVLLPPGNNNSNGAHNQVNSNIARILSAAGEQQQQSQKHNNCGTTTTYERNSGGNNT
uniref:CXXC-type domain-containing protein n=1 Tax=Meloidogyne javanica TaxID=6303 RepID=A0A915MPX8_MELJA